MSRRFRLRCLSEDLSVSRLDPVHPVPAWATGPGVWAVVSRQDELTIVCATDRVPTGAEDAGFRTVSGWRALAIEGTLDFSEVGILAQLTAVLAAAKVSVFALSTFDTDLLLVQVDRLPEAVRALEGAGHTILTE